MTFLEKFKQDNPDGIISEDDGAPLDCPFVCAYEDAAPAECPSKNAESEFSCQDCWNREMPEEIVLDIKPENIVMSIAAQPGFAIGNCVEPTDPTLHIKLTVDEAAELLNYGHFERKETLGNMTLNIEIENYTPGYTFLTIEKPAEENDYVKVLKETNEENEKLKEENIKLELELKKLRDMYSGSVGRNEDLVNTNQELRDELVNVHEQLHYEKLNPIERALGDIRSCFDEAYEAYAELNTKIVLVRHCNPNSNNNAYLFEVPGDYDVYEGQHVLVDTKKGKTTGICVSSSTYISKDFVEKLAPMLGGKTPLKKVLGVYNLEEFDIKEEE